MMIMMVMMVLSTIMVIHDSDDVVMTMVKM